LLSTLFFISRRGSRREGSSGIWRQIPSLSRPLAAVSGELTEAIEAGTGRWNADVGLADSVNVDWTAAVDALAADSDAALPQ